MSKSESNQKVISARKILRWLAVLCIAFAFCPSFLLSCAGTQRIYVAHALVRQTFEGTYVTDAHPIMILCYLIPIAVFVVMSMRRLSDKVSSRIIFGSVCVDIIMWLIFRSTVKQTAQAYNVKFQTTIWYVFNIISMCLILLISGLVLISKISMDGYILYMLQREKTIGMDQVSEKMTKLSDTVSQIASNASATLGNKIASRDGISGYCSKCGSAICLGQKYKQEEIIGYCSKCGAAILIDNLYCTSCGCEVPESMIEEGEIKKKELEVQKAEEQRRLEEERRAEEERRHQEVERRLAEEQKRKDMQVQSAVQHGTVADSPQMGKGFMFCPHCGTKQDSDATFCSACGKKIN